MAVIILEGPDNSGKTTLAYALAGWLGPNNFQYMKSPANSDEWSPLFDHYVSLKRDQADREDMVMILDRVPEVSELVHGVPLRNECRLDNPFKSLSQLRANDVVTVMTSTYNPIQKWHKDWYGNAILDKHITIRTRYEMVFDLLSDSRSHATRWDWRRNDSWGYLLFYLMTTLQFQNRIPYYLPKEPPLMTLCIEEGKALFNES